MALKPLELRELTAEEREARESAIRKAKTVTKNAVKVRLLKKKKKKERERPGDVIGAAVMIGKIAAGEIIGTGMEPDNPFAQASREAASICSYGIKE